MCVQDSEKALHNAVAAAKQYVKLKKNAVTDTRLLMACLLMGKTNME